MNRPLLAGAALVLLLAGCPLPQPLSSYPAGTVTPPRILMDPLLQPESFIRVPSGCPGSGPAYDLSARLIDADTSETVSARWFVDYDREDNVRCYLVAPQDDILGPGDDAENPTQRAVAPYHFVPYQHPPVVGGSAADAPGVVHVVEVVVSNRFDAAADRIDLCREHTTVYPFRTPASEGDVLFETQTYRWVFVNVPASATVPCP